MTTNFGGDASGGSHPFPSRTRWLRPGRPKILHWGRCGKIGGCQILWGYSSVGRAPALQAGGHEFESRYLHLTERSELFLENCTLKQDEKYQDIEITYRL